MKEIDFDWGENPPKQGRPPFYDWDRLLDGTTWELNLEEDTRACNLNSFYSTARQAARCRGLKTRNRIMSHDPTIFLLQAYKEGNDSTEVKSDKEIS